MTTMIDRPATDRSPFGIGRADRQSWLYAVLLLCAVGGLTPSANVRADTTLTVCNGCHGPDGVSAGEHIPSIAGLNFRYFYATMQAFRKDRRDSTIMGRIAKGFKTSQLQRLALHYGRQPWTGRQVAVDPELARRGGVLHQDYCEKCHKQNGHFQDKETPPLAGQARGYLLYQMADHRMPSSMASRPPVMQERLEKLSEQDLIALAEFYVSDLTREETPAAAGVDGAVR